MSFSMPRPGASSCDPVLAPFLHADGLPFANVLTADDIDQAFADEHVGFGQTRRSFWTPALTLWTFLSQVLDGVQSCRAAVLRAVVAVALSRPLGPRDTGGYCRARAKLPQVVLQRLALQVGQRLEEQSLPSWRWHGRDVCLVDGFTASMPDTPANQARYPQPNSQKPGLGFPLVRAVVLLSLATGAVRGMALGPYAGKESGETALLRQLLEEMASGTVVVADRFYCSYFMVALLQAHGVDVVLRLHQRRHSDFRRGRRLGADDHVVTWHKPACPKWLDAETYDRLPATLTVREVRKQIALPGSRVSEVVVVTTFLDEEAFRKEEILELYKERWQAELDIRSIKTTLQMDVLRCLSPDMVEKEIWVHILGYNLIRKVAAQAAREAGVCPRQISFAASQQTVVAAWSRLSEASAAEQLQLGWELLRTLGQERVKDRPGRCEPRAVKRRPKKQKRLTNPRQVARAEQLRGQDTGA